MALLENLFYWRLPFWCSLVNWGFMSYVLHTYLPVQCPMIYRKIFLFNVPWFTWKSSCSMPPVFLHTSSCSVACLFYLKVLSDQSVNQCHLCFTCNLSDQHHLCSTCRSFCSMSLVLYMQIFLINVTCVLHADHPVQRHLCFPRKSSCSMSLVSYIQIFPFYTQIHLFKIQKWQFDSIMVKHV